MKSNVVIRSCPQCKVSMSINRVKSHKRLLRACYFYFLHCDNCGYVGPTVPMIP